MNALAVAVLLLGLFAPPAWGQQESGFYELGVDGLGCPFCAYGIEKKLSSVEGVESLEVDIKKGLVVVRMAEGATLDEATANQAVEEAGFSLRSFEQVSPE